MNYKFSLFMNVAHRLIILIYFFDFLGWMGWRGLGTVHMRRTRSERIYAWFCDVHRHEPINFDSV